MRQDEDGRLRPVVDHDRELCVRRGCGLLNERAAPDEDGPGQQAGHAHPKPPARVVSCEMLAPERGRVKVVRHCNPPRSRPQSASGSFPWPGMASRPARRPDREVGVVAAVLASRSEKSAAHRLGLSHSTVKHHLANARSKVGAATTAQLVWILAERLPEPEGLGHVDERRSARRVSGPTGLRSPPRADRGRRR